MYLDALLFISGGPDNRCPFYHFDDERALKDWETNTVHH